MPGEQISFSPADGVLGNPVIDGWTGNQETGVITSDIDAGWGAGDRVSFAGGAVFPPVAFQAMRVTNPASPAGTPGGNYLAMAFYCSYDVSFDDGDVVVVALRKAGSTLQQDCRRIDIHPVSDDIGAGTAGDPFDALAGTPGGVNYFLRRDKTASLEFRKGNPAGSATKWSAASLPGTAARVASWRPTVPGGTTTGPVTLPADPTVTFTIPILTAGFPATGAVVVDPSGLNRTITYTGKTATTLTGCRDRPPGGVAPTTVAAGTAVSVASVGWSVELLVPEAGGGDWIPLADNFGVFLDIVRLSRYDAGGTNPVSGYFATQYTYPLGTAPLTGILGDNTTISTYGTGRVGVTAKGVGFQNQGQPELSVGARNIAGGAILGTIEGPGGLFDNQLVAQLVNTDLTANAGNVTAEFRFANWGLGPATFAAWKKAAATAAPTVINLTAGGGTGEVTQDWPRSEVPAAYSTNPHQCVWVRLESNQPVHFAQAGTRRNMDIVRLSEHEEPVEISGVGYDVPPDGSDLEFLLVPSVREILVPEFRGRLIDGIGLARDDNDGDRFDKVWVWTVDGFIRTSDTLTIGKITAENLDPTPGQFGVIAAHDVASDALGFQLLGGGIQWTTGGFYTVRVPAGGTVQATVRLNAASPGLIAEEDAKYLAENPPVPVEPRKPGGDDGGTGDGGTGDGSGSGGGGTGKISCGLQLLGMLALGLASLVVVRRSRR